jgi:hypothetical protein
MSAQNDPLVNGVNLIQCDYMSAAIQYQIVNFIYYGNTARLYR